MKLWISGKMLIYGLQKLTLLDYPGETAATVFLNGCDFRCPYCHNSHLLSGDCEPLMDEEELFSFLDRRKGLLDAVVVSGGEPCLNRGLKDLICGIKDRGFKVKLDTNGNHPEELKSLIEQGLLDYVAMDIKNSLPKYGLTIGIQDIDTTGIRESVSLLLQGKCDYEFRTTVVKGLHELEDFTLIGKWIEGAKRYFLQQFVQRDSVPDRDLQSPDKEELDTYLREVRKYVPNAELRGLS